MGWGCGGLPKRRTSWLNTTLTIFPRTYDRLSRETYPSTYKPSRLNKKHKRILSDMGRLRNKNKNFLIILIKFIFFVYSVLCL